MGNHLGQAPDTHTHAHTHRRGRTDRHTLQRPTERLPAPTQRAGLLRLSSSRPVCCAQSQSLQESNAGSAASRPPARGFWTEPDLSFRALQADPVRALSLVLIRVSRDFPSGSENSQI